METFIDNVVDRIRHFIDSKGISIREFSKKIGVSHALIGKVRSLGSDKLERIVSTYPEINPDWLLTGKGEMIKKIPYEVEESINVAEEDSMDYLIDERIAKQLSKMPVSEIAAYIVINEKEFNKDNLFRAYIESVTMDKMAKIAMMEYLKLKRESRGHKRKDKPKSILRP